MEISLPFINPVNYANTLVNNYKFVMRKVWNAHHLYLPETLGEGALRLFIRNDFHFIRGKWKCNEPTRFTSKDQVGLKGTIDFRVNNGGQFHSCSLRGEKNFDWDVTEIDGFRFFIPEKYFDQSKQQLAQRFDKYCLHPNIIEVQKQLFKINLGEVENVLLLESKILEFIYLWVDYLKKNDISSYFDTISNQRLSCIENAREIIESNFINPPSIKSLSRIVGLNECDLKRDFRKLYGLPMRQFAIKKRMEEARRLVQQSDLPIQEISDKLGYKNRSHFADLYYRYFEKSPLAEKIGLKII